MKYDVVVIGAGHNGLVSACYLAKAGLKVLVLEKNDVVGGAAVSRRIFPDFDARISEYAYLVSLFPQKIIDDLGLDFRTLQRPVAWFTPREDGEALLMSNVSPLVTAESFKEFCGEAEYGAYQKFQKLCRIFAEKIWPTMLEPLVSKTEMRRRFRSDEEKEAWNGIVEEPLGNFLERHVKHDALRGLIFTDAKIGVHTHPHDETLLQNRTFLYHIIGGATGEWRIPRGGMGSLTDALKSCATEHGAWIFTNAEATAIAPEKDGFSVEYHHDETSIKVSARYVLANVAPRVLKKLLHQAAPETEDDLEGCQLKINMLLKKLPRLRGARYSSQDAFTGTFHVAEGYEAMKKSYEESKSGKLPSHPPGEMYCHTLTDPSILGESLQKQGYHTLTFFGLDAPYALFKDKNGAAKKELAARCLKSINAYLDEPIWECLALDTALSPCLEVKSPVDIEEEIGMPRGNIFHQALSWPFAQDGADEGLRGVETEYPHLFICGSGARRGGAVSGIPGYHAAMKVLERKHAGH